MRFDTKLLFGLHFPFLLAERNIANDNDFISVILIIEFCYRVVDSYNILQLWKYTILNPLPDACGSFTAHQFGHSPIIFVTVVEDTHPPASFGG